MRVCSRDVTSSTEIADLAASDPVVTAELLRVVNSPFFSLGSEITSIPRAVTVLGQRALRNLALCIAVRDALKHHVIVGFDTTEYWEDALRRAVSAPLLARETGMDPDECFTAGLLQDFGLLVLIYLNSDKAPLWINLRQLDPDSRLVEERTIFGALHDQVIILLGQSWTLPDELPRALGDHHNREFRCGSATDLRCLHHRSGVEIGMICNQSTIMDRQTAPYVPPLPQPRVPQAP
jgi:HD-like signal output (HDOD) protein